MAVTAETQRKTAETQRVTRESLNGLTEKLIGLSIKVHKTLGPGFMERIYEQALAHELGREGIPFIRQKSIKVEYEGIDLGLQRLDLLVQDAVVVEVKSVGEINEIHEAQMLSYLKTADKRVGLILNFARPTLDIKRMVNKF